MNVLITGISGFIGSQLAAQFTDRGDNVYGVDNYETGLRDNWPSAAELDIVDRKAFYEFANHADPGLVVHCAASYKDPNKWHRDVDTNVTGTINALLVAKHHDCPIVYFQTALPPVSSYAISKIAGQQYIEQSGVPYLIFRLANVYGPRNLSGPIPTFYKRLMAGQPCTVVDTKRDMVYISDLLRCVEMALSRAERGVFDVCSGLDTSIVTLYNEVAKRLSVDTQAEVVHPLQDDVPTELDFNRRLPGWNPKVPVWYGVGKAVEWYEANGVEETFTHLSLKG